MLTAKQYLSAHSLKIIHLLEAYSLRPTHAR